MTLNEFTMSTLQAIQAACKTVEAQPPAQVAFEVYVTPDGDVTPFPNASSHKLCFTVQLRSC